LEEEKVLEVVKVGGTKAGHYCKKYFTADSIYRINNTFKNAEEIK